MLGFGSQLSWPSQTNSCLLKGRCKRTGEQGPIRSKYWLLPLLISSSVKIFSYIASPTFFTVIWVNTIQFWSGNGSFCAEQPVDWLTACLIWLTDWLTDCLTVWLNDSLTKWLSVFLSDWLTEWLSDLTDSLTACPALLTVWLIVCLTHGPNDF